MIVSVAYWNATDHHVGITNGLHFVDIIMVDDGIEQRVQVVQQINNLKNNTTTIKNSNKYTTDVCLR